MRRALLLWPVCLCALACPGQQLVADGGPDGGPECFAASSYYLDWDGDGLGSQLDAPVTACAQPAGRVGNRLDCADHDGRAKPGADFQPTAIDGGVATGLAWDFNCDGVEEPQSTRAAPCGSVNGACWGTPGSGGYWLGSAPKCGTSAPWVIQCMRVTGGCYANTETRVQACR